MAKAVTCDQCKEEPRSGRSKLGKKCLAQRRKDVRQMSDKAPGVSDKAEMSDTVSDNVEMSDKVGAGFDETALVGTRTGAAHRETNAVLREKLEEANGEIARLKKQLAERGKQMAPPRIASLEDMKGFRKAQDGEVPCGRFCQTWHEHIR